ncbi:MAG: energy-coupling factor transporter ATPase [Caldilineaceae bacterium]|nr:energy-coupling factor transporter ATPase [Caldilineaceae bacterium]
MTPILRVENLHYTYPAGNGEPVQALAGVNLCVEPGEYVAILGHNGSGKSTLAKHLNALLQPSAGNVWVKAWNTRNRDQWREIRATVGMVFQTPDNQIVATIVEEDVAFGPENLGLPRPEMIRRVDWALEQVGMTAYRRRAPHLLSGGQKQRICIAGVLAMHPEVIVLDESTAMLDPLGRQEVLETVRRLNREQGVTVVAITHFMREAVEADRVVVMAEGQIALEGTPRRLFRQADRLRALALDVPPATEIALRLHARYPDFPPDLLTIDEVVEAADRLPHRAVAPATLAADAAALDPHPPQAPPAAPPLIEVEHLVHDYMRDTPLEVRALHDVSLALYPGEIVGILGHTGSGKSTAVQHLNGLLRAHGGRVVVLGQDLSDPKTELRAIRRQVGLVFQFPEAQLFERFVGDDVAFGPRNLNLSAEEVRARVRHAMEVVGLGFEAFKDRMTFSLSGGQMRRVALAGVLALEPRVLVLDEPTAGLDPQGRRQLLDHILGLQAEGITLVMISHNMEELAELCDRLYVIAGGKTVLEGTPGQVFAQSETLRALGLDVPAATLLAERLAQAGVLPPGAFVYTVDQAERLLVEWREGSRV